MKMKTIGNVNYMTIGEAGRVIDRSAQTIKNWYKWCEAEGLDLEKAGLPVFRRDLDAKGTYYFAEPDLDKLLQFRKSIQYGQMAEFNLARWGRRGKEIEARKQELEEVEAATPATTEDSSPANA
jgi:hypothetical protein